MATEEIGAGADGVVALTRAPTAERALERLPGHGHDREDVVAVHLDAGEAEARRALVERDAGVPITR